VTRNPLRTLRPSKPKLTRASVSRITRSSCFKAKALPISLRLLTQVSSTRFLPCSYGLIPGAVGLCAHSSSTASTSFEVSFRLDEPHSYLFTYSYSDDGRAGFQHAEEMIDDATGQKIDLLMSQLGILLAGKYTLRDSIAASAHSDSEEGHGADHLAPRVRNGRAAARRRLDGDATPAARFHRVQAALTTVKRKTGCALTHSAMPRTLSQYQPRSGTSSKE